jgi:hypothetical protein
MDWIDVEQDRDPWRVLMNTVTNLQVLSSLTRVILPGTGFLFCRLLRLAGLQEGLVLLLNLIIATCVWCLAAAVIPHFSVTELQLVFG